MGYADTHYTRDEREVVDFLRDYWKIQDSLYQEMIDVAETVLALEKHKKWVEEEMKAAADLCNGTRRRSAMFNRFLIRLQTVFDPLIFEMSQIIKNKGTDFRKFSDAEKKCVASAMSFAGAIKAVLDTPILDNDGNLTEESGLIIENTQKKVNQVMVNRCLYE